MLVSGFAEFLLLVTALALSIFLSLPVILAKAIQSRTVTFLNAASIGILVFLLADIFGDVASLLAGGAAYLTIPSLDVVFVAAVVGVFTLLYAIDQRPPAGEPAATNAAGVPTPESSSQFNPLRLSLIISVGIGLQNLTEGLVFGSAWSAGAVGLTAVIFFGFFLQNITEGFPVVSPFLTERSRRLTLVAGCFLIAGIPTIIGGAVGYFFNSHTLDVLFDSLAVGAILYVIVPMLRVAMRPETTRVASYRKHRLVYFGLLAGFVLGFVVNAL